MSQNKQTIQTFLEAVSASDWTSMQSCLSDDIEWVVAGVSRLTGKSALEKQIRSGKESGEYAGTDITLSRMTDEDNVVVAEGCIRCTKKDGKSVSTLFCEVFVMQDSKIKHVTAYLSEIKE